MLFAAESHLDERMVTTMNKKYRYSIKNKAENSTNDGNGMQRKRANARKRMLILLFWATVVFIAYFLIARYALIFVTYLFGGMLIAGLLAFLWFSLAEKRETAGKGDTKKLKKYLDIQRYLLIFIIPLIFVLAIDFLTSTLKML